MNLVVNRCDSPACRQVWQSGATDGQMEITWLSYRNSINFLFWYSTMFMCAFELSSFDVTSNRDINLHISGSAVAYWLLLSMLWIFSVHIRHMEAGYEHICTDEDYREPTGTCSDGLDRLIGIVCDGNTYFPVDRKRSGYKGEISSNRMLRISRTLYAIFPRPALRLSPV